MSREFNLFQMFNISQSQNICLHRLVQRKKHRDAACWNEPNGIRPKPGKILYMSELEQKKGKSTAVQPFLAFAIQLNDTQTTIKSHRKYQKIKSFKEARKGFSLLYCLWKEGRLQRKMFNGVGKLNVSLQLYCWAIL